MSGKSYISIQACGQDSGGALTSSRCTGSTQQKSHKYAKLAKHHNGNKENEGNRNTLLAIRVEIEDGCSGHIQMKEGDSAEGVATAFCRDYSLPEDFITPLTEHILSNLINISKKDKNIIFCTTEERDAYEARLEQSTSDNYPDENNSCYVKKSGGECVEIVSKYQHSSCATPGAQFQNVNRPSYGQVPKLTPMTIVKTRSMLAQRLLCPTHSSRSKTSRTENMKRRKRRMSDIARIGCLRLYSDFLTRKRKLQELWRQGVRLYAERVDKSKVQSPKKSRRIYRRRLEIAKRYRNYGELLYTEGLLLQEKLLKEFERKKREDAVREMIGFTGMPSITERARHMQRDQGNVWHKLASEKFNFDQIRCEVMEAQMAECTFMPQINPSADEPTDASISRFDQLFFDSTSRIRRQKQYSDWYPEGLTFQPAINRRLNNTAEEPQISVFDRLSQGSKRLHEKKTMDNGERCGVPIDKTSGREMFTPLTGRKPQTTRNPKSLPIGVFLHEMQGARACKKEILAEKEEKIVRDQAKCHYVTPTSQKYLTRLKQRAFRQMFDALDTDKDGSIQLCKVDVRRVSFDAAQDINTLIKMGKGNECLSSDTFRTLMHEVEEKYHKGSSVRGNLRHVNHVGNNNITFEYKVGRLSSDLAGRRRKYSSSDQWYNIILQDAEMKQQKVEALRKERQKIEMKECTFAPELATKPSSRSKGHCRPRHSPLRAQCPGPPTILEKVAEEMHGFIFQGDGSCEPCKQPDDKPADEGPDSTLAPFSGLFTVTQSSLLWQHPDYLGPDGFQSLSVSNLPANVCRQRTKLTENPASISKRKLPATLCRQQTALVEHFRIHDHMVASKHAQTD